MYVFMTNKLINSMANMNVNRIWVLNALNKFNILLHSKAVMMKMVLTMLMLLMDTSHGTLGSYIYSIKGRKYHEKDSDNKSKGWQW